MTCGSDDEHVAQALVEDDLGGDAGVAASEEHGGGMLAVDEFRAAVDALTGMQRGVADESLITLGQGLPR